MAIFKSFLALALLIVLSLAVQASPKDCIDSLMIDSTGDSYNFRVHSDNIADDFGHDYLAEAISVIRVLADEQGCSPKDINFGDGPLGRSHSKCDLILPDQEHSRVCYVETNVGYFFVTRDLLDTFNITYSRWD